MNCSRERERERRGWGAGLGRTWLENDEENTMAQYRARSHLGIVFTAPYRSPDFVVAFNFIYMYVCVFACLDVRLCAQVPSEFRGGCWSPWNYRKL